MQEGIGKPVERVGCYKFQTGDPGRFGWVRLSVEPCETFCFSDERPLLDEWHLKDLVAPAVERGLQQLRGTGPAWGHPLRVRVRLLQARIHLVDSCPRDFGQAASVALADAVRAAPVLFSDDGAPVVSWPPLRDWQLPPHHTVQTC